MKLSATIKASPTLKKTFEAFSNSDKLLQTKLQLAGFQILGEAQRNIQRVSPGRKATRYDRPRGKRLVTVSKPGDSPNTDTGTSIKSIRISESNLEIEVGTQLDSLAALEFNSRKNKRKARPWLRPALMAFLKKHGTKFFIFKFPKAGRKRA